MRLSAGLMRSALPSPACARTARRRPWLVSTNPKSVGGPPTKTGFGVGRKSLPPAEATLAGLEIEQKDIVVLIGANGEVRLAVGGARIDGNRRRRQPPRVGAHVGEGERDLASRGVVEIERRTSTAVSITRRRRGLAGQVHGG